MTDNTNHDGDSFWGEPIHVYTREQGIQDGSLVAIDPELVAEAGYRVPVVLTRAAYLDLVQWSGESGLQDEVGRAWDVLFMARAAAQRAVVSGQPQLFRMVRVAVDGPVDDGEPIAEKVTLRLVAEGGRTPAVTIMLETED